jgi:hypothetical protein
VQCEPREFGEKLQEMRRRGLVAFRLGAGWHATQAGRALAEKEPQR